jgi:phenol hydroxylase P1 protein
MNIEIKTSTIEPIRHTFDHVAARIGGDKLAPRYLEGTLQLQSEANFHYRPMWDQEGFNLYDPRRTAVVMADWEVFRDPRQFYYGSYTIARSKQQDAVERNFAFIDKRGLLASMSTESLHKAAEFLLPLRHYEWGANMNNGFSASLAYGSMLNVPMTFHTMDRLGLAQYLTQIGLQFGQGTDIMVERARNAWLEHAQWQPLRRYMEDLFVERDWFEVFIAQNVAADGLLFPLAYVRFPDSLKEFGTTLAVMIEFFVDWHAETSGWVDSVIKIAAAESDENKALLSGWYRKWRDRAVEALGAPIEAAFGSDEGAIALRAAVEALDVRVQRLGLDTGEE